MKLIRHILFVVLLVFGNHVFPQAPGYMGKRMAAGYGFNFNPMLNGSNAENYTLTYQGGSSSSGKIALNITHQGFFEYAVRPRLMLGADLRYFRTGYDNRLPIGTQGLPTDFYTISNIGVSVYNKLFYRRFVAPWGSYFCSGFMLNASTSKNHEFMYLKSKIKDRDTLLFDFGPDKQVQLNFDILVGFGKSRIVANRYSIEYGFNTQLIALFSSMVETTAAEVDRSNYIYITTQDRVHKFMRFNLFLKLGYLF